MNIKVGDCSTCANKYAVRDYLVGCNKPDSRLMFGSAGANTRNYQYPTSFDPAYRPVECKNWQEA